MQPPVLGQEHLVKINQALYDLSVLMPEIEKAARAGIDVSQQRAAAQHYQQRLQAIKSTYFPGHP